MLGDELNPIWKLDSVQKQMTKAAQRGAELYAENMDACFGVAAFETDIESPLEAVFLVWWEALKGVNPLWNEHRIQSQQALVVDGRTRRIDFVLLLDDPDPLIEAQALGVRYPGIAIELDGHDFHERTKSQVIDRNERDRGLQATGWTVFHFSGTELYRDPEKCLTEVMEFAIGRFGDFKRELFYAQRAAAAERKDDP